MDLRDKAFNLGATVSGGVRPPFDTGWILAGEGLESAGDLFHQDMGWLD